MLQEQQQKQRPGVLQERPVAPAAAETASGSALWLLQQQEQRLGALHGTSCGSSSTRKSVRQRHMERPVAPAAAETASGSVTGAPCGSHSSRNSAREHYRSVMRLLQQQKKRPAASQERPVAPLWSILAPFFHNFPECRETMKSMTV